MCVGPFEMQQLKPQGSQREGHVTHTLHAHACHARNVANGLLESSRLTQTLATGVYEAKFHIAVYYRSTGVTLPGVPFLDIASYRFGIDDPQQHYHLPFKMTPWGYSCFRGGA